MASALYTVPLASTPPVSTPRATNAARQRSSVVSFSRSEEVGSWKGSYADSYSHSLSALSRSLGRSRTPEVRSSKPAAPVQRQTSIPKSASFVRQEGFATRSDSPISTPPTSPQPRSLNGLLSRQLSSDASGFVFDDPLAAINRLEQSLRLTSPAQTPRPRPDVLSPAELLTKLQVRGVWGSYMCCWYWCGGCSKPCEGGGFGVAAAVLRSFLVIPAVGAWLSTALVLREWWPPATALH